MIIRLDTSSKVDRSSQEEGVEIIVPGSDKSKTSSILDLCIIRFDVNGVLEVIPDFCHGRKQYQIEDVNGDAFEFWVEHVSPSMKYEVQLKEAMMMNDIYSKMAQHRLSQVGDEFEMPPKRVRINIT